MRGFRRQYIYLLRLRRVETLSFPCIKSLIPSIGWYLSILDNDALPDCEVCALLDQITSGPIEIDVKNNLDDSCTPVPDSCP